MTSSTASCASARSSCSGLAKVVPMTAASSVRTAVLSAVISEGHLFPGRDGLFDLFQVGHQRQAEVTLTAGAERLARAHDDALLEQSREERLRCARRHFGPQVDRALAARDFVTARAQVSRQAMPLGAKDRAPLGNVRVVAPGDTG